MAKTMYLAISDLRFSRKRRRGVSPKRAAQLQAQLESECDLMPIRVNALGDGTYTVKDGRHRIQAHLDAGLDCILATIENIIETIKRFLSRVAGFFLSGQKTASGGC